MSEKEGVYKKAIKVAKEGIKERRIHCPYCKEHCCNIEISDLLYRKIIFECGECLTFICDCCGKKFSLGEDLEVRKNE